ncbi:MAG: hypothetical protein IBX62_03795 [Coriobacteriia bacterium]|nr:hypothetical protein [Coriobacteriia bacterium]
MSGGPDTRERARRLRELYEAKARAELAGADALAPGAAVPWSGDPLAPVAAVKGVPGEAELGGGAAFSGRDGEALRRALAALGETRDVFLTCSRPDAGMSEEAVDARLRAQLAVVDPSLVIATDAQAARDVARALGVARPRFGQRFERHGTTFLAVDGLEASLDEERRKARVWRQLTGLRRA